MIWPATGDDEPVMTRVPRKHSGIYFGNTRGTSSGSVRANVFSGPDWKVSGEPADALRRVTRSYRHRCDGSLTSDLHLFHSVSAAVLAANAWQLMLKVKSTPIRWLKYSLLTVTHTCKRFVRPGFVKQTASYITKRTVINGDNKLPLQAENGLDAGKTPRWLPILSPALWHFAKLKQENAR